uniref:DNA-directed DNA polymerase n=1 Tax=Tanacetum cinerariifolium TaxID=118510 RepID=A0A6L2NFH5_TANCI|nr:DNA-directed DNA polymerase [Tanacetum cinerariifolium]
MCDASDFAVGAVLGQRIDGKFKLIFYASKTLNNAQEHYTTTEKEILAVVFSFDKFCPYLILLNTVVYTDHSALKFLFSKQDAKPRLIRTAYKTPTGCTPFRLVYGKACHLPVEIKHKSYWVLKQCNIDLTAATKNRFLELNELMELRDGAYENTRIYKEKTKRWYDSRLCGNTNFKVGDKVLLFKSRFKMHPGKHKSRWYGPNMVTTVYLYGTIEINDRNGISFKVNGQRTKKYHDEHIDAEDKEVVKFEQDTT